MRLLENEKSILVHACEKCFGDSAQIWLFGSRADPNKKGGDIDLYIETSPQPSIFQCKLDFRREIRSTFGEQKIDLIVHERNLPETAFHSLAKETGILLT